MKVDTKFFLGRSTHVYDQEYKRLLELGSHSSIRWHTQEMINTYIKGIVKTRVCAKCQFVCKPMKYWLKFFNTVKKKRFCSLQRTMELNIPRNAKSVHQFPALYKLHISRYKRLPMRNFHQVIAMYTLEDFAFMIYKISHSEKYPACYLATSYSFQHAV